MRILTDTYEFQKARIIRIVDELAPGKVVEFDDASIFIRFRVRDPFLNIDLTDVSGEWLPCELDDKSDDWMRTFINGLAHG